MTVDEMKQIFNEPGPSRDCIFEGLTVIKELIDVNKACITKMTDEAVYSVKLDDIKKNATPSDIRRLKGLGWVVNDDNVLMYISELVSS